MAVLEAILLAFLGLVALVVLVPFRVRASGEIGEGVLAGAARVDWGFGFLSVNAAAGTGVELRFLGLRLLRFRRRGGREGAEARPEREAEPRAGRRRSIRELLSHRQALFRMAVRLLGAARLRLRLSGAVGTGDPAEMAMLVPIAEQLQRLPGVELRVRWEWVEEELELEARCSARIWIAHLLVVAAGLLLHRENRAVLRTAMS